MAPGAAATGDLNIVPPGTCSGSSKASSKLKAPAVQKSRLQPSMSLRILSAWGFKPAQRTPRVVRGRAVYLWSSCSISTVTKTTSHFWVPNCGGLLESTAPPTRYLPQLEALVAEAREKPVSRRSGRRNRQPNADGEMPCSGCGSHYPPNMFYSGESQCKECHKFLVAKYQRTLRGNITTMLARSRHSATKRGLSCFLKTEDIFGMLVQQGGRCAYSSVPMEILRPHSHWRMSVERLNNLEGYSRTNCVLICAEFNSSDYSKHPGVRSVSVTGTAQWSVEKVRFVGKAFDYEVDERQLALDVREAHCVKGMQTRPCSDATSSYGYNFYRTLRGKAMAMTRNAKRRSAKRGHRCVITSHDILDMLLQQEGRCFYSGVPLEYKQCHTNWVMSLERLDNKAGYLRSNCALIATEFNTPDHSLRASGEVHGSSQWSRAKVTHVWGRAGCFEHRFGSKSSMQRPIRELVD